MDTDQYTSAVDVATAFLRDRIDVVPETALILGTGLSGLGDEIVVSHAIPYEEIPHFPGSTVASHRGQLLVGHLHDTPVIAMQGRFHLYEGYSAEEISRPVRVLANLGSRNLIVSNAAGGLNPQFHRADIMLITDHVNLQGVNPLEGPNVDDWGPRFPDMSEPYDVEFRKMAEQCALDLGIRLVQGVYLAVMGPNLETRAEYRLVRALGADVVGMSTVPEVLVARHMGMRILAFSVITDECFPDALEPVALEDVLAAAAEAEPRLRALIGAVIDRV